MRTSPIKEAEECFEDGVRLIERGLSIYKQAGRKVTISDVMPDAVIFEERRAMKATTTRVFDAVVDELRQTITPDRDSEEVVKLHIERIRRLQRQAELDERFINQEFPHLRYLN